MLPFTSKELTLFSDTYDDSLQDLCVLANRVSGVANEYGEMDWYYSNTSGTKIGLLMPQSSNERIKIEFTLLDVDAIGRFSLDTNITTDDYIVVYQRYGVAITPLTLNVVGFPMRGSSGLQVNFKRRDF